MEKAVFTHRATLIVAAAIAIILSLVCTPARAEAAYDSLDVEFSHDGRTFYDVWTCPDFSYTGEEIIPYIRVFYVKGGQRQLLNSDSYTVSWSNNVNPGKASIEVAAQGIGHRSFFTISPLDLSKTTVTLSQQSYDYNGYGHCPKVTVTYNGKPVSEDFFDVSYEDNIMPGTAKVYVHSSLSNGFSKGEKYATFRINDSQLYHDKYDIANATIKLSQNSYVCRVGDPNYDYVGGEECRPEATVVMGDGGTLPESYYKVSYKNNIHAGTASVTVNSRYNCFGSKTVTFKINPRAIKKCEIYDLTCTGKKQTPSIYGTTPKIARYNLKAGRDYSISVSRTPKAVGTYQATITFKGDFSGKVKKTFKILPAEPVLKKAKALSTSKVKVSWKKVKGATGYKVYRWNSSKKKLTLYKTTKSTSCIIERSSKYDQHVIYQVRAYTKTGGKTYASASNPDTETAYLKLSRPAFSVTKAGWGAFDVRFKGRGLYQVQVSSNKSFRKSGWYEDVKSYRNETWDQTVFSFYGLDTGQKVYIRARSYYYNDSNKLVVGPWSATKSCTVY